MLSSDNYDKIHTYLLSHGQQELAGHLDNLWQEVVEYRPTSADVTPLDEGETPPDSGSTKSRGDGLDQGESDGRN